MLIRVTITDARNESYGAYYTKASSTMKGQIVENYMTGMLRAYEQNSKMMNSKTIHILMRAFAVSAARAKFIMVRGRRLSARESANMGLPMLHRMRWSINTILLNLPRTRHEPGLGFCPAARLDLKRLSLKLEAICRPSATNCQTVFS